MSTTEATPATLQGVDSTEELDRMSFAEHRDRTAADLDAVIELLQALAKQVRDGDIEAFERWWFEGGTEQGDAFVFQVRDMLMVRFSWRDELLRSNVRGETEPTA